LQLIRIVHGILLIVTTRSSTRVELHLQRFLVVVEIAYQEKICRIDSPVYAVVATVGCQSIKKMNF